MRRKTRKQRKIKRKKENEQTKKNKKKKENEQKKKGAQKYQSIFVEKYMLITKIERNLRNSTRER
jgi:hypothetical protein